MKASQRRTIRLNSLGALGLAVLIGVVVTTLAQADGAGTGPYVRGGYGLTADELVAVRGSAPRNGWLLGNPGHGAPAQFHIPDEPSDGVDLSAWTPPGLRVTAGALEGSAAEGGPLVQRAPMLLSDTRAEQHRLNTPVFSLSVGRSW